MNRMTRHTVSFARVRAREAKKRRALTSGAFRRSMRKNMVLLWGRRSSRTRKRWRTPHVHSLYPSAVTISACCIDRWSSMTLHSSSEESLRCPCCRMVILEVIDIPETLRRRDIVDSACLNGCGGKLSETAGRNELPKSSLKKSTYRASGRMCEESTNTTYHAGVCVFNSWIANWQRSQGVFTFIWDGIYVWGPECGCILSAVLLVENLLKGPLSTQVRRGSVQNFADL